MKQGHSLTYTIIAIAVLSISALSLTACSGAKLSHDGRGVMLGDAQQVKSCRLLGKTRISVSASFAKAMPDEKVAEMLLIEARNFAGRIGADTVVGQGAMSEGSRIYKMYYCGSQGK